MVGELGSAAQFGFQLPNCLPEKWGNHWVPFKADFHFWISSVPFGVMWRKSTSSSSGAGVQTGRVKPAAGRVLCTLGLQVIHSAVCSCGKQEESKPGQYCSTRCLRACTAPGSRAIHPCSACVGSTGRRKWGRAGAVQLRIPGYIGRICLLIISVFFP